MADLDAVHDRLRSILRDHADGFRVTDDSSAGMKLEMPGYEGKPWGYVAGTRVGKRYVSYYLMSVYGQPDLLDSLSPGLRRRMQGKSCFNFTTVDELLVAELDALTAKAVARHPEVVAAALVERPKRR
jgi:hypothetical protein